MSPDSITTFSAALSPDEWEVVVFANTPTGAVIGAVTLDAWKFRALARFPKTGFARPSDSRVTTPSPIPC
jgi:hypothetical protein